jgi:hypothetical protein
LTSESEERETWTAGSLRAASSIGEGVPFSEEEAAGRDNGGTRFLGTTLVVWVSNHSNDYMLDLVNVAARERRYAQNV